MRRPIWPFRRVRKKTLGLVAAGAVVALGTTTPAQRLAAFPDRLSTGVGQDVVVPWSRWLPVSIASPGSRPVMVFSASGLDVTAQRPGHYLLTFRLFGLIPWRGLPVDVQKPLYVVPGGESVGVLVHTRGLVVTGYQPVMHQGRALDPAESAGLERGDVILRVDGRTADTVAMLDHRINWDAAHRRDVSLTVQGARRVRCRVVEPVWSPPSRSWRIGALVQDHTSGVGTLTFFDPATRHFAALGHSLTDGLTRRPVGLAYGRAVGAEIVGLVPATESVPGQKVGVLSGPANVSGSVVQNGEFGIVGVLDPLPIWGPQKAIPVAFPDQVHAGPAEIVTVLHGQTPDRFKIEIVRNAAQYAPGVKGLLFKVTDPRLIHRTGGIIQGMSGSPIIQNGRVVGAVTHVLVNRPLLGYGCYAYWMATQASFRTT